MSISSVTLDRRGLNDVLARPFGVKLIALCVFLSLIAARPAAQAAPLEEARVSHVIQDVRLLATNAAPRPAAVNDNVRQGTAVRTGTQSRAELTFSDLTITRIGENTVFSFKGGSREVTLDSGAILLQVPQGAEAAKIRTAAVTASITGGTGLMNANKGYPSKLYMMEGAGELCVNSGECVTAHGGEMVMEQGGQLSKPQKFNAKLLFKTSPLLADFPPLPNESLFFEVFNEGGTDSSPPPKKDPIDVISLVPPTPSPSGSGSPDKFGPPVTIASPDPYVISSGTQINTDPTITTNGVTDQGKLYRGTAVDGFPTQYLFGEAPTAFDLVVIDNPDGHLPAAVFKFSRLQLTGDPTILIPSGATTNLGLVSVSDITSGGPGGTLTFAGIDRLTILTQAGSINLGSEISFSGLGNLSFYARGSGSNLTLACAISGGAEVGLDAEGTIQVNGNITATDNFRAFSGGDFLAGTGTVTTTNLDIESLSNITVETGQFHSFAGGATVNLNAANTLTIIHTMGAGGGSPGEDDSFTAQGTTINFQSDSLNTFDRFLNVSVTAGSGGIQAPNVLFATQDSLLLQTTDGGDINIDGVESASNGNGGNVSVGTIDAAGAVNATANITNVDVLTAGTTISVGGTLGANTVTAGTTIHVGGDLFADTVSAGGNIDALGVQAITINAADFILTVGSDGIHPVVRDPEGASLQHTFNVDLINSPNGIDFSGNQFGGIGGLSSGGRLTINGHKLRFGTGQITFATFDGADAGAFSGGGPSEGGSGGVFIVNSSGTNDITADTGANITATTGLNTDAGVYSGAGGSVTLHAFGGSVTVNNTIQVSSDDGASQRQSASGGTILLQSDLTSGPGVTVGANAQLLSLLNANAPGPGGSITLSTMGADITVAPGAVIQADRGTITMDQNDPAGTIPTITIDGATLTSDTVNIEGAGTINIGLNNPVTINSNELELQILNELDAGVPATSGGTIAGDSTINVSESTLSTGGFVVFLLNENDQGGTGTAGGHIDGSASITMNITGALTVNGTGSNSGVEPGAFELFIDNYGFGDGSLGGHIGSDASINVSAGSISTVADFNFGISNDNGGNIGGSATINVTAGSLSVSEFSDIVSNTNSPGGTTGSVGSTISGSASISLNISGALTVTGVSDNDNDEPAPTQILLFNDGPGDGSPGGYIGSDASITVNAGSISDGGKALNVLIGNTSDATIAGSASITVNTGSVSANKISASIFNSDGGTIGSDASVSVTATDIQTTGSILVPGAGNFLSEIDTSAGGHINGSASVALNANDISAAGVFNVLILNFSGGTIGSDATIDVTAASITAGSVFSKIDNSNGGNITGKATITVSAGAISTDGNADFQVSNSGPSTPEAGTIATDAEIKITAAGISAGGLSTDIDNTNGNITGAALIDFGITGDLDTQGGGGFIFYNSGGTVGSDATLKLAAVNITVGGLGFSLFNGANGMIGGIAKIDVTASGDISGPDLFHIYNNNAGSGAGSIGSDAIVNVSANSITADSFEIAISNEGGSIGGKADVEFNFSGNIDAKNGGALIVVNNSVGSGVIGGVIDGNAVVAVSGHDVNIADTLDIEIFNPSGSIGGGAAITLTAANISADSLFVSIDNRNGGTITGDATIDMNLSGDATVTNDATVQILGDDPTGSAAINFNGGNYGVGGTFLSSIDGDGVITFANNTTVHADIVKVGVFGTNGTLMIGGGSLRADTVLKLYAPGSNGTIDFNANVTLNSGTAMHLAANTITIDPGVTVNILGAGGAANIYTEHPNYNFTPGGGYMGPPGTPGNGSFGVNGALDPVPLASAPAFGASASSSTSINVSSSGQLLSMLDTAVLGPGGNVTVAASNRARNSATPRRFNAEGGVEADRGRKPIHGGASNTQPPSNLAVLSSPGG